MVIPLVLVLYLVDSSKVWPLIVAYVLSGVTIQVIKSLFRIKRPAATLENACVIGKVHHHRSFPSGHTATAMALSYVLSYDQNLLAKFVLFIVAFLVGYSRVYIGVHFPLDVLVGAFVGIVWGHLATQYNFSLIVVSSISVAGMVIRYRNDVFGYLRSWIFYCIRNVAR